MAGQYGLGDLCHGDNRVAGDRYQGDSGGFMSKQREVSDLSKELLQVFDRHRRDWKLSLSAYAVFHAICSNHMGRRPWAISQRKLAEFLGSTRPTISRALDALADAGLLRVQPHSNGQLTWIDLGPDIRQQNVTDLGVVTFCEGGEGWQRDVAGSGNETLPEAATKCGHINKTNKTNTRARGSGGDPAQNSALSPGGEIVPNFTPDPPQDETEAIDKAHHDATLLEFLGRNTKTGPHIIAMNKIRSGER